MGCFNMEKKLCYLASPYNSPESKVKEYRYQMAVQVAGILANKGLHVFSPIAHSHPIMTNHANLQGGWEYWQVLDLAILDICKALYVLTIEGWRQSVGVTAEIARAKELGIPIMYIDAQGDEIRESWLSY